jgi:Uma2 family endonuclease
MASAGTKLMTAEQLASMPDRGRCELIKGELVMMALASHGHGRIAINIAMLLANHVKQQKLGVVYAAETGFIIARNPDTVRAPDVAFVHRDRVIIGDGRGYFPGPPDLAVEVISPSDKPADVQDKADEWLVVGVQAVWIVWPHTRSVTVHQSGRRPLIFHEGDALDGADVVPGFRCDIAEIFE